MSQPQANQWKQHNCCLCSFYLALDPVLPDRNFAQVVVMTKGKAERVGLRIALIARLSGAEGAVRGGIATGFQTIHRACRAVPCDRTKC